MQKRQERIIGARASTGIDMLGGSLLASGGVRGRAAGEPAIGVEFGGVGAPELAVLVEGRDAEDDGGAFGDDLADDGGGAGGDAEGEGDGGVEAEDFEAEGVQVGDIVDDFGGDWGL